MLKIDLEAYLLAIESWENTIQDMNYLQDIFITNHAFTLPSDGILHLVNEDESGDNYFRFDVGVMDDAVILILVPQDGDGEVKEMDEYYYIVLQELTETICFKQITSYEEHDVCFSTALTEISNMTDTIVLDPSEPGLSIDTAIAEVMDWKDNGIAWMENQNVDDIFRMFYLPKNSLIINHSIVEEVRLFMGLKADLNDQTTKATMIVLSQHEPYIDLNSEFTFTANTLNFAKPCPPH